MERVDQRMKGMTWDETEEVGIEILARCLTHHIFVAGDGEEFAESLPKRVAKRVREMVEEHRTAFALLRAKEKEFMDENGRV